jgi:hypothetical protein
MINWILFSLTAIGWIVAISLATIAVAAIWLTVTRPQCECQDQEPTSKHDQELLT